MHWSVWGYIRRSALLGMVLKKGWKVFGRGAWEALEKLDKVLCYVR